MARIRAESARSGRAGVGVLQALDRDGGRRSYGGRWLGFVMWERAMPATNVAYPL